MKRVLQIFINITIGLVVISQQLELQEQDKKSLNTDKEIITLREEIITAFRQRRYEHVIHILEVIKQKSFSSEELKKIDNDFRITTGVSLGDIVKNCWQGCNSCDYKGYHKCPTCWGVGLMGLDGKPVKGSISRKTPLGEICPKCKGMMLVSCEYCDKRRRSGRYQDLVNYFNNFFPLPPYLSERPQYKGVTIRAEVTFDIQPPLDFSEFLIYFTGNNGGLQLVKPGEMIKPGEYSYEVVKTGYFMKGGERRVSIPVGKEFFTIQAHMEAVPRDISIVVVGHYPTPKEILINNIPLNPQDKIRPGTYRLLVRFDRFKDVETEINIPPAFSPFVFSITKLEEK